jgi:TetR/AcrR family transcriptional repressor of bet genes
MADVTQQAGLSMGIVNLHFETKEKLLIETLRFISTEYTSGLTKIFNNEKLSTEEKITSHVSFDFSRKITDRNKLAVWFAFWGETKSRPTYLSICADYINEIATNLTKLFAELKDEGNYTSIDPELVCVCYTALSDGLWLDLLVTPRGLKPDQAQRVAMHYLGTQFYNHFSAEKSSLRRN